MQSTRLLVLVTVAIGSASAFAQTAYRCPDAQGKITYTDTPCATGQVVQLRPASGADSAAPAKGADPLDALRKKVDGDIIKRRHDDAKYREAIIQQRLDQWESYRVAQENARRRFVKCGNAMCEDLANTKRVIAELADEFNGLLTARTNAAEEQRIARSEYFEVTKKRLP